jgi:hypothetical protein
MEKREQILLSSWRAKALFVGMLLSSPFAMDKRIFSIIVGLWDAFVLG